MLRPTAKAKSPRMVPERISSSTLSVTERRHTWGRGEGVRGAEHSTAGLDGVQTLPDHGDDGTSGHVLDQTGEEGLVLEILIV